MGEGAKWDEGREKVGGDPVRLRRRLEASFLRHIRLNWRVIVHPVPLMFIHVVYEPAGGGGCWHQQEGWRGQNVKSTTQPVPPGDCLGPSSARRTSVIYCGGMIGLASGRQEDLATRAHSRALLKGGFWRFGG